MTSRGPARIGEPTAARHEVAAGAVLPADTVPDDVLVRLENLHVEFALREGSVRALNGVAIDIHSGETLGLVGESGCGKSVTSQAILGIIQHPGRITDGRVLFQRRRADGSRELLDVARLDSKGALMRSIRSNDVSIIFQEPMTALSPIHTVGRQITEKIRLRSPDATKQQARDQAVEMLGRVGIPRPELRFDAYTFELSGGMRQRAMIAMALVSDPSLLIADEPTTAVDVTIQAQVLELLQRMQAELNMSTLIITHNLGVVAELTQRVAVMYLGKIVETATTDEIFENPKHPYTEGLIKSIPRLTDDRRHMLWAIEGVVPAPTARIAGCSFHPRCHQFMPGSCDRIDPPEIETDGHRVRCLLHGGAEDQPS